jgi:acyl-CoA thioesterase-1
VNGLVVALGGNDVLRGIDPAVTRANLEAIMTKAGERHIPVLLVGITAPGNYGADYKARFDAIFPDLAAEHHALFYPGFFTALAATATEQQALATLLQADGIHPNAKGVGLIVADFGPDLMKLVRESRAP